MPTWSEIEDEPSTTWAEASLRYFARFHLAPNGRPLEFSRRKYLKAVYDDEAEMVAIRKSTQGGLSMFALARAIHGCRFKYDQGVIYYLPSATDMKEMVDTKLDPLIKSCDLVHAKERKEAVDNARTKRIGRAFLTLRGMKGATATLSASADLGIWDELDRMTPEDVKASESRLSGSEYKHKLWISNPTIPDFGIDRKFGESDQKFWMVRCPKCRKDNVPTDYWPDCLAEMEDGEVVMVCQGCRGKIDRMAGKWVAKYPGRKVSGYHFSQLFSVTVSLKEIWDEWQAVQYRQVFYNFTLGLPWLDAHLQIAEEEILRLAGQRDPEFPRDREGKPLAESTMGIDQGKDLHVIISWPEHRKDIQLGGEVKWTATGKRVILPMMLKEWEELDALMPRYNVQRVVSDAMPETRKLREFSKRWPGKVWANWYDDHVEKPKWDIKKRDVHSNRTLSLDFSRDELLSGRQVLPPRGQRVNEFAAHCKSLVKVLKQDSDGNKWYEWVRKDDDHFRHAHNYDCLAWGGAVTPRFSML